VISRYLVFGLFVVSLKPTARFRTSSDQCVQLAMVAAISMFHSPACLVCDSGASKVY
jgi:hypothetical protein